MTDYLVQMVGAAEVQRIEAHTPMYAVAEAAGCDWAAVCLPIWESTHPLRSCFMPRDDSGRQWIVTEAPTQP